jgi:transcription initiation factor TFIIB
MKCPDCGGLVVTDWERGEVACMQCGLVVSESAVDTGPEWRISDREKRERTAPLKLVVKTDMAVRPEHGERWRRLARFHKETLHNREWRLAEIGGELRRVKDCADLPQNMVEEAEALVKRYFEAVAGSPPEVAAVAVLWTAAKAAGVPRPLEDFLKCSKAEERRVRKAAWRLKEAMRQGKKPSIENYVKTVAARVNLPPSVVKRALDILGKNKRLLSGKNPWVWAAAALWLAFRMPGLLKGLAAAAGVAPASIREAAKRLRA